VRNGRKLGNAPSQPSAQRQAEASVAQQGFTLAHFRLRTGKELRAYVDELYSGNDREYLLTLADCLEGVRVEVVERAHRCRGQ